MARKRARISGQDVFDSTTERQQDSKTEKPQKVKNTFHITQETTWRLEDAQLELRRSTGEKLSKSEIIEAALILALNEYEAKKDNSQIAILLSKQRA